MTFFSKSQLAHWGEALAKSYLEDKGILIRDCNYRTNSGEIDLIGIQDERFIFFEVKTRQSVNYGFPEEAVDIKKLEHIETVIWDYFETNDIIDCDWQIDVISILRNPGTNKYEIEWFENVLE
jgi:putative endonuclease